MSYKVNYKENIETLLLLFVVTATVLLKDQIKGHGWYKNIAKGYVNSKGIDCLLKDIDGDGKRESLVKLNHKTYLFVYGADSVPQFIEYPTQKFKK